MSRDRIPAVSFIAMPAGIGPDSVDRKS